MGCAALTPERRAALQKHDENAPNPAVHDSVTTALHAQATIPAEITQRDLDGCSVYSRRNLGKVTAAFALGAAAAPLTSSHLSADVSARRGDMFIVAHQDDDLLFMNPVIQRRITAGAMVVTVYLTAGDAGRGQPYWSGREAGVQAAYAAMAAVGDAWNGIPVELPGSRLVRQAILRENPNVRLIYVNLPSGDLGGDASANNYANLRALWRGQTPTLRALDGYTSYSSAGALVQTLTDLMYYFGPAMLHTLDPTTVHGNDHGDHTDSALFADAAALRYDEGARPIYRYRGYNAVNEARNLGARVYRTKFETFLTYASYDAAYTDQCGGGVECLRNTGRGEEEHSWRLYYA